MIDNKDTATSLPPWDTYIPYISVPASVQVPATLIPVLLSANAHPGNKQMMAQYTYVGDPDGVLPPGFSWPSPSLSL